jgi:phosphatidylethanolamine-binding protein (PEBP) family uncharacterized protein
LNFYKEADVLEFLPQTVGKLLKKVRPGLKELIYYHPDFEHIPATIQVTSTAFKDEEEIPVMYTADGKRISPPLQWQGVPQEARSLVCIIEDADSPTREPIIHALIWDLDGNDQHIPEGGLAGYLPPDPPPGHGSHRYAFQLFALSQRLEFVVTPSKGMVKDAMQGHVLAKGCLIGRYERQEGLKILEPGSP